MQTHRTICDQIVSELYDRPILSGEYRAEFFERRIAEVLAPDWRHVGGWNSVDLEHVSRARMQVKQSGALTLRGVHPGKFDISERVWFHQHRAWERRQGRHCDLSLRSLRLRVAPGSRPRQGGSSRSVSVGVLRGSRVPVAQREVGDAGQIGV
jgi:hypothetical protein